MFKKIIYLSRLMFWSTTPRSHVAVISVSDPGDIPRNLDGWGAVLKLQFCDLSQDLSGYRVFEKQDAIAVIDFLQQAAKTCETLVVHCEAGVSRSGAIAYYAAMKSNLATVYSADRLEAVGQSQAINKRVFAMLMNEKPLI